MAHLSPFTHRELVKVVELHSRCFTVEDNFAMRLGQEFLYATYRFFLDDPKAFGFVAKRNTELCGVLVGRLDYYTSALNRYRIIHGLKAVIRHPSVIIDRQLLRKTFKGIYANVFQAKADRKLVLAPSHEDGKTATLASFFVHPDSSKLKIGDSLLSTAEKFCREQGMLKLRTGVRRTNVASRFSFRSRGYIEDDVLSTDSDLLYYLPLQAERS